MKIQNLKVLFFVVVFLAPLGLMAQSQGTAEPQTQTQSPASPQDTEALKKLDQIQKAQQDAAKKAADDADAREKAATDRSNATKAAVDEAGKKSEAVTRETGEQLGTKMDNGLSQVTWKIIGAVILSVVLLLIGLLVISRMSEKRHNKQLAELFAHSPLLKEKTGEAAQVTEKPQQAPFSELLINPDIPTIRKVCGDKGVTELVVYWELQNEKFRISLNINFHDNDVKNGNVYGLDKHKGFTLWNKNKLVNRTLEIMKMEQPSAVSKR